MATTQGLGLIEAGEKEKRAENNLLEVFQGCR
jgi:hypothetical protein